MKTEADINKMIYTFTINGKPKAIEAKSIDNALEKIIDRHLFSFCERKIHFISSNDPNAPKDQMEVSTNGLYDFTRLRKIKPALLIIILLSIVGCAKSKRECAISVVNAEGLSQGSSYIYCDSFQMEGTKKAFIWIHGTKMNVEATNVIYPYNQ